MNLAFVISLSSFADYEALEIIMLLLSGASGNKHED